MSPLSVSTAGGGLTGGGGGSSRGRRTISETMGGGRRVMRFTPVQITTEKPHLRRTVAPPLGTMVTTRRSSVILTNIRELTRRPTVITKMPTVGTASTTIITKRKQPCLIYFISK